MEGCSFRAQPNNSRERGKAFERSLHGSRLVVYYPNARWGWSFAAFITDRKIVECDLPMTVARIRKELFEQFSDEARFYPVIVVLPVPAIANEPYHPQER